MILLVAGFALPAVAEAPNNIESTPEPYVREMYVEVPQRVVTVPAKVSAFYRCSCINYSKLLVGFVGTLGNAWDVIPNSFIPAVGSIVLLKEGRGHAAVVTEISGGKLHIAESNYSPCQISDRWIQIDSPVIRGYRTI